MTDAELLAMAQQVLATQPFSQLLGAQLLAFSQGLAEIALPITPDLLQQFGFVHGGVLSYAADNALTFAGGSVLGPNVLTAEYKINYLKPAQGERLVARAKVLGATARQAVCACEVWAVAGTEQTLCAVAQGTIVAISK